MNVRTVCLSILFDGEATGYEIRRLLVEGEYSYFVEASFGSIYPALAKMEAEGLVTSRTEQQDGKPAKKVYAITDAGRTAFVQALFEPLGEETFRSPFLLFARFANLLPAELVEMRLNEQLEKLDEKRRKLSELANQRSGNAADAWILNHGLACLGSAEKSMRASMQDLIDLARPSAVPAKAAE
jgi:PadR family transcriptional regulator, regulatory protein AphA